MRLRVIRVTFEADSDLTVSQLRSPPANYEGSVNELASESSSSHWHYLPGCIIRRTVTATVTVTEIASSSEAHWQPEIRRRGGEPESLKPSACRCSERYDELHCATTEQLKLYERPARRRQCRPGPVTK